MLLTCVIALGGARHHLIWSVAQLDDVALFADETPRLSRLAGTIVTEPYVVPKKKSGFLSAWPQLDRTVCTLRCTSLASDEQRFRVSGLARLEVTGHLLHVQVGDQIEVVGRLSRPRGPRNAGEFDFREYLRRDGIRSFVRTNSPDAVRRIRSASGYQFWRSRSRFRNECEWIFANYLSERTAPVARALLLGSRSAMNSDVRAAFTQSGTMHLLAISGLHVGILVGLLWGCCRVLNLATWPTTAFIVVGVAGYAFITDARPPVVRASILILIAAAGWPWYRRGVSANTLAIAALVVLAWNPTDLFNIGAQLSFLAVTAILWSATWRWTKNGQAANAAPDPLEPMGRWRARLAPLLMWFTSRYAMTAAIWFFTVPLVAATFNLISPVGLLINVLLIPVVVVTLWFGYGLLFCGLLMPPLARFFAFGFDGLLNLLLDVVDSAAQFELGHLYVPAPPGWWLAGIYLLMAVAVCYRTIRSSPHWAWCAVCLWLIFGLSVGLSQPKPSGLRCTFLAVGHGCSILVETPNGKTLLYDAGMISDGNRAQDIVSSDLWSRGLTHIDALIVSHADLDHYNAVPYLMRTIPVASLFVSQPFLDFQQKGVAEVCRIASSQNVPVTIVWKGDRIALDDEVAIRVLHPAAGSSFEDDNESSIVLAIEYAGRRILLTGDLEGHGMQTLLKQSPQKANVLLAPHHGSPAANPPQFARWANPDWLVISGGRPGVPDKLRERYGPTVKVLSTIQNGAVTFKIDPNGRLRCRTFAADSTGRRRNGKP